MRRGTFVGLAVALLVAGTGATASGATPANPWPAAVVAGAVSPTGAAILDVQANGSAHSFGHFFGDAHKLPLAQPITGIASTPTGKGYWLVAADGGVFSYGDAHFFGSMGGKHLNQPIVGIASARGGRGYWLVAADGGIFTFGDAPFLGSLGGIHLVQPIVGMSALRSGAGYRLVARDGGVFTFGQAVFEGSLGDTGLNDVVGMAQTPSGNGYWILRKFGGTYSCSVQYGGCAAGSPSSVPGPSVYNFGDAQNLSGPIFASAGVEGRPIFNYDFTGDPVVAIEANPVAQGYGILRAQRGTYGFAGRPPGTS